MTPIDPTLGPRAALFEHFMGLPSPWFTLCVPLRVDAEALRARGGLFLNLVWAALAGVQAVPELRRRLRGPAAVVEHPHVDCTCTVDRPDGSFTFCLLPWDPDREAFLAAAPAQVAAARARPGLAAGLGERDDLAYFTSFPWREVTGVVHAGGGDPLDAVPRVLWGRAEGGRLSLCLTAHHALVDGLHAARFFDAVEAHIAG